MKSPGALWPVALVAVLAVTVVANVALLVAARDPHAAAVEPDYYRKAVAWDSLVAVERRSVALGWSADANLAGLSPGRARVRVTLRDGGGRPLAGARVTIEAVHNRAADQRVTAELSGGGDGAYEADLPLARAGLWEIRMVATRGADRFVTSLRREAVWPTSPR